MMECFLAFTDLFDQYISLITFQSANTSIIPKLVHLFFSVLLVRWSGIIHFKQNSRVNCWASSELEGQILKSQKKFKLNECEFLSLFGYSMQFQDLIKKIKNLPTLSGILCSVWLSLFIFKEYRLYRLSDVNAERRTMLFHSTAKLNIVWYTKLTAKSMAMLRG